MDDQNENGKEGSEAYAHGVQAESKMSMHAQPLQGQDE